MQIVKYLSFYSITFSLLFLLSYTVHGSTASLVSTASSLAAGAGSEERQAHEVHDIGVCVRVLNYFSALVKNSQE